MRDRSPTVKLVIAGLIGLILLLPMIMVYGLVSDRQNQAQVAQNAITAGAGGAQVISGPFIAIPVRYPVQATAQAPGQPDAVKSERRSEIYLFPEENLLTTDLQPERKRKAIYETVTFLAKSQGRARFELPQDMSPYGVTRDALVLSDAEIRFAVSDPRGLRTAADVKVNGQKLDMTPGMGSGSTGGFHGRLNWAGDAPLAVDYTYLLHGSSALSIVPQGGSTKWDVTSSWQHPGFAGAFLPDERTIDGDGFSASWSVGDLALGQGMMSSSVPTVMISEVSAVESGQIVDAAAKPITINLVDPVDIYSQVDRSVKYGFLFIGFTFLAFLLFDVIGGARVAAAEYMLTGAGLILFFVLLLAFAEVIGFARPILSPAQRSLACSPPIAQPCWADGSGQALSVVC